MNLIEAIRMSDKITKMRDDIRDHLPESFAHVCGIVHPILDKLKPDNALEWAMNEGDALKMSADNKMLMIVAAAEWLEPSTPKSKP